MNARSKSLETGLWIAGGAVAVYILIFAILWCDSFVWKTQYAKALPAEVLEILKTAYFPVIYSLDKFGLVP